MDLIVKKPFQAMNDSGEIVHFGEGDVVNPAETWAERLYRAGWLAVAIKETPAPEESPGDAEAILIEMVKARLIAASETEDAVSADENKAETISDSTPPETPEDKGADMDKAETEAEAATDPVPPATPKTTTVKAKK